MSSTYKPDGYSTVSPYLITANAQKVIDFLRTVLEAEPVRRFEAEDGSIHHAEVRIDDTVIMLGEAGGDWQPVPCHLHVYVPDVDRVHALALENGAEEVQAPVRKEGDSDKRGGIKGPGGNTWWFATHLPS